MGCEGSVDGRTKQGFHLNIEKETTENNDYRRVLYTSKYSQLVVMALQPKEEIGMEVHEDHDQFFRFEAGTGKVIINQQTYQVKDGDCIIVPAGANHNVINDSESEVLKLYTIYSPPEHRNGVLHKTKKDDKEEHFDGVTSE